MTRVAAIEFQPDGAIRVRLEKTVTGDRGSHDVGTHLVMIRPGDDEAEIRRLNDQDLTAHLKCDEIDDSWQQLVAPTVQTVHSPAVVRRYAETHKIQTGTDFHAITRPPPPAAKGKHK